MGTRPGASPRCKALSDEPTATATCLLLEIGRNFGVGLEVEDQALWCALAQRYGAFLLLPSLVDGFELIRARLQVDQQERAIQLGFQHGGLAGAVSDADLYPRKVGAGVCRGEQRQAVRRLFAADIGDLGGVDAAGDERAIVGGAAISHGEGGSTRRPGQ